MKSSWYFLVAVLVSLIFACTSPKERLQQVPETNTVVLPDKLDEISGLQMDGKYFYGFNDSGGAPELYKMNEKGNIIQTIRLKNATNVDWESIAMNDSLIFLADVGNNRGNRKDLCIYYIRKKDIDKNKETQEVMAQKIRFYYPEQTNFEKQTHAHNFDCEAVCWHNGKLHLFTKEWKSKQTHHYTVEIAQQLQAAKLVESYNTKFLVTAADIRPIDNKTSLLAFVGYTKLGTVHLLYTKTNSSENNLLSAPKIAYSIGRAGKLGQVEGICISSPNTLYYSAEAYKNVPQHITKLKIAE